MALQITLTFIGLFALLQIPMTLMVGARRAATRIHFYDEGDETLRRRQRAHANFTETVPMALLAMAAAELAGAPSWMLFAGGGLLFVGRTLHCATVLRNPFGLGRAFGMVMTLLPMLVFGGFAAAAPWLR